METPRQLVARFERGEIDRMEFQAMMAIHQRELIVEIDEDHQNPLAAWLESRLAKSSVKKLLRKHTPYQIREVIVALSEAPGFPLANYLWNAVASGYSASLLFPYPKRTRFSDPLDEGGRGYGGSAFGDPPKPEP